MLPPLQSSASLKEPSFYMQSPAHDSLHDNRLFGEIVVHSSSASGLASDHLDTCVCEYSQRLSMSISTRLPARTQSKQSRKSCWVPRHVQSNVLSVASHHKPWQALATAYSALTYACCDASHFSESRWVVSRIGNAAEGSIACWRLGVPDGQPTDLVCDAVADWEHDKAAVDCHCRNLQGHAHALSIGDCHCALQMSMQA